MKIQLSRIGHMALLLTAAIAGVQRTQAQTLPIDVRLRTVMVQGLLWSSDWGPNPGPDDGPVRPFPVDVVPIIVHNCAPLPCPDYALGTNTITLGPGGFFTMPIVIPEEFLADASAVALKFAVRANADGEFTMLSGTLPLTSVPYASVAQSVIGPVPASSLTGTMPTGMLTGTFSSPLNFSNPGNVFAGDGSFLAHVNAATLGGFSPCDLPCYWKLTGNAGTDPSVNFLGTKDNVKLTIGVNKYPGLQVIPADPDRTDLLSSGPLEPFPALPNIVGGYGGNRISTDARGSTIAGGGGLYDHVFHSTGPGWNEIGPAGDFCFIGSGSANYIKGPHNAIVDGHYNRIIDGNYCFIGGGGENLITAPVDSGAIVAGLRNTVTGSTDTNLPSGDCAFIGAGHDNTATNFAAFIGGGGFNLAAGAYSVVSGGDGNQATGLQGTVGGGWHNIASGWAGVVAGGYTNVAAGQSSAVGGGYLNIASNLWTTIGGGAHNVNRSDWGPIGGGYGNLASGGVGATVPGGEGNSATAAGAFAAGTHATAAHEGAFAFADRQPGNFSTDRNNQFAVRAENGVMIQGTATALDLRGDGAIRVAGAGVASRGPVFIHRATAGSISSNFTIIDHPLANGDPNAILLVTHNYNADTSATPYEPSTVGVWYNGSRWTIYHENTSVAMPAGRAFNVMIIKP